MRNSLILAILLAACNNNGHQSEEGPDAAMPDGSVDGTEPPQMGPVSVVVSSYSQNVGAPIYSEDVPVVFYKPDGSVGSVVRTDANGKATATIERNSFVAVVNSNNYIHVEAAIVQPGDTLRFGPEVSSRESYGILQVSWPARTIPGYTTYYYVDTPCGYFETTATSATQQLYKGCAGSSFDVVITSRRSSQEMTGIMTRRNVTATGGNVSVNMGDAGATWNVGTFTPLTLVNSPNANAAMPGTSCTGVQYLGTLSVNSTGSYVSADTCSMRLLPDPMTTWSVEAQYGRNNDARYELRMRQSMPQNALVPIDGAGALPWLTNLAFDVPARMVSWASEGPAQVDGTWVRVEVSTSGRYLIWRVFAPNGLPPTFKLPKLPADLAQYDLLSTDTVRVELEHFDVVGVPANEVATHSLDESRSFLDKARRASYARIP